MRRRHHCPRPIRGHHLPVTLSGLVTSVEASSAPVSCLRTIMLFAFNCVILIMVVTCPRSLGQRNKWLLPDRGNQTELKSFEYAPTLSESLMVLANWAVWAPGDKITYFSEIATLANPKANISVSRSVLFCWYWLLLTQRLHCVGFSQDPLGRVYIILLSELSSENEHLGTH